MKRARTAPGDLADEILTDGGRWSLDSVRFRPQLTTSRHSFAVTIDVDGRSVWSGVRLDSRPARDARPAAELLERAGYEILSVRSMPFFARRSLRGFRELDAEVRSSTRLRTTAAPSRTFERVRRGNADIRQLRPRSRLQRSSDYATNMDG